MDLNETDYETALWDAFRNAKKLARKEENSEEVLIAKLATLAIRQLHASDIVGVTLILWYWY